MIVNNVSIRGSDKLLNLYAEWPSFHDAEILSLCLDRNGPTLTIRLFVFQRSGETDEAGFFKRLNKSVVTFRFDNVDGLEIEDFNHQNVVAAIGFAPLPEGRIEVNIQPLFGLYAEFTCAAVEVSGLQRLHSQ